MSTIRPALPEEAEVLSALAVRSKAHGGYAADEMAVFQRELALSPADVVARRAHVVEEDRTLVAFYTLLPRQGVEGELEHLFVEPTCLGRGIGRALLGHACLVAREAGWERLVILSDPNAAGFYRAMGAQLEAHVPSSVEGRTIPVFSLDVRAWNASRCGC